jgi:hypothetical protein
MENNTSALHPEGPVFKPWDYLYWLRFLWFSSDPLGNCWDSTLNPAITTSFLTLFNFIFTNCSTIQCYTVWAIDSDCWTNHKRNKMDTDKFITLVNCWSLELMSLFLWAIATIKKKDTEGIWVCITMVSQRHYCENSSFSSGIDKYQLQPPDWCTLFSIHTSLLYMAV